MRKDMSRVIIERPRSGGDWSRLKKRFRHLEDLPSHEGIRRPHRGRKRLNENLNPLRRYLEKQVGRPWSKIYSEISEHVRADNTVQQHVRDHIKDFVAITPRREVEPPWSFDTPWRQPLYVDPKDGILKRTDQLPENKARRHRKFEPREADEIRLGQDHVLRRIKGFWYEFRTSYESWGYDLYGREIRIPHTAKRSLSRAELRRHGLTNEPEEE